jgi:hypothetical protein
LGKGAVNTTAVGAAAIDEPVVAVGVGVGVGVAAPMGVRVGTGVGVGVAVGVAVGEVLGRGVAVGLALGLGLAEAPATGTLVGSGGSSQPAIAITRSPMPSPRCQMDCCMVRDLPLRVRSPMIRPSEPMSEGRFTTLIPETPLPGAK